MQLEFESERLSFRPLTTDDLDLEISLWTDIEVAKYITGETSSVDEIEKLMPAVTQRGGGGAVGLWCITERSNQERIGHAALLPLPVAAEDTEFELLESNGWPDRDIEIGFVLKREFWGFGYATEACTRLLEFFFTETNLDAVFATTASENLASQNVLMKSGMRDIGLIPAFAGNYPGFRLTREIWEVENGTNELG